MIEIDCFGPSKVYILMIHLFESIGGVLAT
jgi:hypothetical protein